jgi:uncharacterized YigZ family protein
VNKDTYLTIEQAATGLYKSKGSKFITYAYPVNTEEEVKTHLADIRKKHFDARHHCYAYLIGTTNALSRAYDDGEPNYSAGKPIFGQLQAKEITNVLIIVARYFGGTLLGVGGLVSAYKNAAADALNNATIIEKTIDKYYHVVFDFSVMNDVMKIIKDENLTETSRDLNLQGIICFSVRKSNAEKVYKMFNTIELVTIKEL